MKHTDWASWLVAIGAVAVAMGVIFAVDDGVTPWTYLLVIPGAVFLAAGLVLKFLEQRRR